MLPFISNGKKALDIRPIHNLDKLLAYCTKQFEIHHPSYKVIDSASSDIDLVFIFITNRSAISGTQDFVKMIVHTDQ